MQRIIPSIFGLCLTLLSSHSLAEAKKAPAKPAKAGAKKAAPAPAAAPAAAPAIPAPPAPVAAVAEPMTEESTYGMAGCGLGSVVISKNEAFPQFFAAILNGFSGNQTSGITSGTSNCVESRTQVAAMEQEVFMRANLSSLSREAAQGSGEHIGALAEVFGCREEGSSERLGQISQDRYAQIFTRFEPETVLNNYLTVIQADPILGKTCSKTS